MEKAFPIFSDESNCHKVNSFQKREKKTQKTLMRVFAAIFLQVSLCWSVLTPLGSLLAEQISANHF